MTEISNAELLQRVQDIAYQAGQSILEVYESDDFGVEQKDEDGYLSPLTKADKLANDVIVEGLMTISDWPIVSEENTTRDVGSKFWLVDPLDGTKEFVKRNGEFTVNIALIEDDAPVLGIVYAPVLDRFYYGDVQHGTAYRKDGESEPLKIRSEFTKEVPVLVTSKSHKDEHTQRLLDTLTFFEEKSMGSSLKLCLVAEGEAMLYPRLAPTSLWDTAAADAVVRAAGGAVTDTAGSDLVYNPNNGVLNPFFVVATGNNTIQWKQVLGDA